MNDATSPPPSRAKVVTAFALVYVIWGSTYLAIRLSVATFPPFLMAGLRYLVAGGLMYAWLRARGQARLSARQWRQTAITGTLLVAGGSGVVSWAEQTVNSSLAALILTSTPIWFAVFDTLRPGGRMPKVSTALGLVVGAGGMVLLITGSPAHGPGGGSSPAGVCALVVACALWAGGSLYNKYHTEPISPWMSISTQMLCGGAANALAGVLTGEAASMHPSEISQTSWLALAYLIVFGSLMGFSSYIWLLTHCAPARVSTYAYVNPVIATLLGWWLLKEPLTPLIILAGCIILVGVFIVQWPFAPQPKTDTHPSPRRKAA